VFVAGIDGQLIRVDSTGATRWSVRVRAPVVEPVQVDGTMLFVVSQRGEMVAFR
jgi:hypothetical protein